MALQRWTAIVALSAVLISTGCGDSPRGPAGSPAKPDYPEAAFPVSAEGANGTVTLRQAPARIISLSPTATEILFAVGAGDQVVAVDDQSDYPPGAPQTKLSGLQPNLEAILSYKPDLVVTEDDSPSDLVDGLERVGVPVLAQTAPNDFGGAYEQMRDLGALTGHRDRASAVVDDVRSRVEELLERAPEHAGATVFHELSPDLYTVSSRTFIGRVYRRLGLRNIADDAARRAGTDYPQLSPEAVVAADPDVIVLADVKCCAQTPAKVRARAGWHSVAAVRRGAVVAIEDAVASRWSPRLPQFVDHVVRAMRILASGQ